MSTSRGNSSRTRSQKHQNKSAFKNNLHDKSDKTKFLNSLEVTGVCKRCKDIIEWKIKYKKYKPLTSPRKCVGCDQKAIKYAYHVLCSNCTSVKIVCAKCCKPLDNEQESEKVTENIEDVQTLLKNLPERKRRTVLRHINKQDGVVTSEVIPYIEDIFSGIDKIDLENDF